LGLSGSGRGTICTHLLCSFLCAVFVPSGKVLVCVCLCALVCVCAASGYGSFRKHPLQLCVPFAHRYIA